jgi:hypothetical protein
MSELKLNQLDVAAWDDCQSTPQWWEQSASVSSKRADGGDPFDSDSRLLGTLEGET